MNESWSAERLAIEAASIEATLQVALANPALLAEYDRLAGTNLGRRGSVLDHAVDDATGRSADDLRGFLVFAKDALWDRADEATRNAVRIQVRTQAQRGLAL